MATQTIIKIIDHVLRSQDRLTEQYKDLTNFKNFIEIFADQIQDLEDVTYDFIDNFALPTAIGDQLDIIGAIVGIKRPQGATDDTYRALIYAKIAENSSTGTRPDIVQILESLQCANIVIINTYPAGIDIQYDRYSSLVDEIAVKQAVVNGSLPVEINLTTRDASNSLTWTEAAIPRPFGVGVF